MPSSARPATIPGSEELARALGAELKDRPARIIPGAGRRAAVLLALYDREGETHLILTKRSHEIAHPGQVSLPGGRFEASDLTLKHTALRETEEEIGIPASRPRVLGRLDDVETMVSGFVVSPFVGLLVGDITLRPDDHEVARIMQVPVGRIIEHDALLPHDAGVADLRYPLDGEDVWGATARILRLFSRAARRALGFPDASTPPG
ncbi:MAG: NUDIX hydrolase [Miltoncostaeaceae bacterium]